VTSTDIQSLLEVTQDKEADIELLRQAISQQSVSGKERNYVDFLKLTMMDMELHPGSGGFLTGRPNLWDAREGAGNGPTLMFVGHTDTVHVRGWSDNWKGHALEDPFSAQIIDDEIWGRGACDLKAGICASLGALRLLDAADIELGGGVTFAFIGDEESGEPDILLEGPTAALGVAYTARVEELIASLKAGNLAILIISHSLDQIFRLSDRICVLRRGEQIGVHETAKTNKNEIVSMITGVN
jgi:hypothetical protein